MHSPPPISQAVDHLFRHESGKMVAAISRLLGLHNIEVAQDIVQDTLLQAMTSWSYKGLPENPSAWLYRVAKNKAIDFLRREKTLQTITPQYAGLLQSEYAISASVNSLFLDNEIQDSQLRMIFACCHPSIPIESQIAFALKTLCGLSISEIAKAFLLPDDTIAKRVYRAKEKLKSGAIELAVPQGIELQNRLDIVLQTLYLLFNEGYNSSQPDQLIREDLCHEAMRLCFLLSDHPLTSVPRVKALLALLCFQASRLHARLDDHNNIILLKHQDRNKWHTPLIQKGIHYLEEAAETNEISTYHIEAAIAALHAKAISFEQTDWKSIYHLYETLYQLQPEPMVAMNKAIASAYAFSREHALKELSDIKNLSDYYLYFATIGEMYFDLDQKEKAQEYFEKALTLTSSKSEKQLLQNKISRCV